MPASRPVSTLAPATVLCDGVATTVPRALAAEGDVWLTLPDLEAASGWEVKDEGVCRDEVCIPIPVSKEADLLLEDAGETWFNLTEFARYVEQPVAHDARHNVWSFGAPPFAWQNRLAMAIAPDFTLPDFEGKLHSLSGYRGKKVFLVTWASW